MAFGLGALILAGPFVLNANALKARVPQSKRDPLVYVSDLLPGFPGKHPSQISKFDNFSMRSIYGDKICTGDDTFVSSPDFAPTDFCRRVNNQPNMTMDSQKHDDFDEYAMERIMIGKWKRSPLLCTKDEDWCRNHADIVIVPSLALHMMIQEGFKWRVKHPDVGDVKHLAWNYWEVIRSKFHKPEHNRIPSIVMHSAFSWDSEGYSVVLHMLDHQPDSFKASVVIPSTGSNLENPEATLFHKPDWSSGAHKQLSHRARNRAEGIRNSEPLFVTVPYPTSITHAVNFFHPSASYVPPANRRISIGMLAARDKSGLRPEEGTNWIRGLLMDKLEEVNGSVAEEDRHLVCADGHSGSASCDLGKNPNMWDMTVNSEFCIEPAGDTLCRSHFYVAVLSGCIPVIVDGGHEKYTEEDEPTWWAWRRTPGLNSSDLDPSVASLFIDYTKMAVVYNAEDIKEGKVDVVKELREMPIANPARFQALKRNVDSLASMMRYSLDDCTLPTCVDAFAVLHELVVKEHMAEHVALRANTSSSV